MNKIIKNLSTTFLMYIFLFVLIFTLDICYSFLYSPKELYEYDNKLGWRPKSNYTYLNNNHIDVKGNRYSVQVKTNEYGFRAWGDIKSNKIKILFIGDSFTGDANMSDDDAYFAKVGELLDAEVFAFGGGGYGSLQEKMILEKYVNIIKPDVFVLQFCSNDVDNNDYLLEGKSIVRNQKNLRPYLDLSNNKMFYRLPKGHPYRFLHRYSSFFRGIDSRLQNLQYIIYNGYYPPADLNEELTREKLYKDAEVITVNILKDMVNLLPQNTKKIAFFTDSKKQDIFIRLLENAGFVVLPEVSQAVEQAEKSGECVRAADGGHWNPRGHEIAGIELSKEMARLLR
jgi:hypothetical protein